MDPMGIDDGNSKQNNDWHDLTLGKCRQATSSCDFDHPQMLVIGACKGISLKCCQFQSRFKNKKWFCPENLPTELSFIHESWDDYCNLYSIYTLRCKKKRNCGENEGSKIWPVSFHQLYLGKYIYAMQKTHPLKWWDVLMQMSSSF